MFQVWSIGTCLCSLFIVSPLIPFFPVVFFGDAGGMNEAQDLLAVLPWFLLYTVPYGAGAFIGWTVFCFIVWVIAG